MPLPQRMVRASHQIIAGAALGVVVILATFAHDHWQRYNDALEQAERSTLTAARLLAEHTARTFNSAEGALRAVARLHRDLETGLHDRVDAHRLLRAIQGGTPVFKAIGLIDRNGRRTATSLSEAPPPLDVSREEHFRAARDDPGASGLNVGAPKYSELMASWIVMVGLRIETTAGEFDGVAGGIIDTAYFARVFDSADLGQSAVFTLFRRDGTILARLPDDPSLLGKSLAGRPFMTEMVERAPYGTFRGQGLTDSAQRIVGYSVASDGRFVVTVAVRRAEALAEFRRDLSMGSLRTGVTLLALLLGAWLLVRQLRGRERLAVELLAEEAKLRDYAEASSDWFWETDAEHRFVWLSKSIERITGVPADWHYGRRRLDLIATGRMLPGALAQHERCLSQHLPFRDFEYLRTGPGNECWIRTSGVPRFDACGTFLGYRGTGRDVTELVAARRRLQEAVEAIPGDFLLFDADDRLIYTNSSPGRLPQMQDLDRVGDGFATNLRRTVATGCVAEAAADPEAWIAWRIRRHREAAGTTLVHNSGRAIDIIERPTADGGIMVLRFDVTEREEARQVVLAAREAADAANQAKSDFLAGMSHELRTPLNAIIGFGQILQRNDLRQVSAAQQREYADYIVGSGEHLLSLVNDVLDLASVEAGRVRVTLEPVAAEHIVDRAMRTMRPLAVKRSVELRSAVGPDCPPILADAHRLQQVLLNLVSNAIKYNRRDGSVVIAARAREGCVRITVTDTGKGVPAERADELFVPFQRLGAEFSAIEGTGIGLALSKQLVEAMDGRIGYHPEPAGGSTFWIEMPFAEQRTGELPAAGPAGRATRGGYCVLYVEDNPLNVRLMEYLLDTLPRVELHSAPSGSIGIDLALARHPDVIILDLNLPDMDGFRVLAALRAHPETQTIPVIALTASAMPSDVRRGLDAGFRAYLTKPLKFDELLEAMDAALGPPPAAAPARAAAPAGQAA